MDVVEKVGELFLLELFGFLSDFGDELFLVIVLGLEFAGVEYFGKY